MKIILVSLFLLCALASYSQEYLDKKIIVTVKDTANLYQRVRTAFGKNNFQVKEDGDLTTVTTFSRPVKKPQGYTIGKAEISGNTVTLTARYGLLRIDEWGRTMTNNSWKDLVYMKGSKLWPLLEKVAGKLDGKITYSK